MKAKRKVLFLCEANKHRSKTAEALFSQREDLEVRSAGLNEVAEVVVSRELVEWADVVFVMEKAQRNKLRKLFPDLYAKKAIVCLYVEDHYSYMESALVGLLRARLAQYLGN